MTTFKEKVLDIVRNINRGEVMTYAEVAKRANAIGAARAVGSIMKNNYDSTVPCHRVIKSGGTIGDYNRGGKAKKMEILKSEGVEFVGDRVVNLK